MGTPPTYYQFHFSCISLHRSISNAERDADGLFAVRKTTAHRPHQYSQGIRWTILADYAASCFSHRFLHLCLAAARRWTAVESCCHSSFRHLQTVLVAKSALHPQLVRVFQYVLDAHTSRRHRHGAVLDGSIPDNCALEVAKAEQAYHNRPGRTVDYCSVLRDIHAQPVELCLLRNEVSKRKSFYSGHLISFFTFQH